MRGSARLSSQINPMTQAGLSYKKSCPLTNSSINHYVLLLLLLLLLLLVLLLPYTKSMLANEKLIIVMCGLPARGKSYITRKISNYMNWLDVPNDIFNVGHRRRNIETAATESKHDAQFFNPNATENVKLRDQLAMNTLDELLHYLYHGGKVGIFDATNSTIKRRSMLLSHIKESFKDHNTSNNENLTFNVLFLESICNDETIIKENMRLKLQGPDYKSCQDKESALNDFKERLRNYEKCYETLNATEFTDAQYIKIIDVTKLETYNLSGFLPLVLVTFLQNFNITEKKIYLTSHLSSTIGQLVSSLQSPINPESLEIYSSEEIQWSHYQKFKAHLSIDQIHDLLLQIESSNFNNILIQTDNDFFISKLLQYFMQSSNIKEDAPVHLAAEIICINPKHYSVKTERFTIAEPSICGVELLHAPLSRIPSLIMTRSNSNTSNESMINTPIYSNIWAKKLSGGLDTSELSKKLASLP